MGQKDIFMANGNPAIIKILTKHHIFHYEKVLDGKV